PRREDALREVTGRVRLRGSEVSSEFRPHCRWGSSSGLDPRAALDAELVVGPQFHPTLRAAGHEAIPTAPAELRLGRILPLALRTLHQWPSWLAVNRAGRRPDGSALPGGGSMADGAGSDRTACSTWEQPRGHATV